MNIKSKLLFLFGLICTVSIIGQQACYGMDKAWDQNKMQVDLKWKDIQQRPLEIPQEVSTRLKEIKPIRFQPASPLVQIAEQIDRLLKKEDVEPQEIGALRERFDRAAESPTDENQRVEYERLNEKLTIMERYVIPMSDQKNRLDEMNDLKLESDIIYNQVNRSDSKATILNYVLSGGFSLSFITNMAALLSLMIKMPNAKLERQLKQLQIAEKKAQLKQNGIEPENYL
ncbi:MAG: hypothetical protein GY845_01445 [Planctomycetes bacterium]|nr:hypothetical protein [Planctomycetota bacterium]